MKEPVYRFLILTEFNILWALWTCLKHRNVFVLAEHAIIPRATPVLRRVRRTLIRSGLAHDILDRFPEERDWVEIELFGRRSDMFSRTESWSEAYLNYARWPLEWAPYGMAFRQISSKYWGVYCVAADFLNRMRVSHPDTRFEVTGALRDFKEFYSAYFGNLEFDARPSRDFRQFINPLIFVFTNIFLLFWCLKRTRLIRRPAEPIVLGVDYHGRQADFQIISNICDINDEVLFVYRHRNLEGSVAPPSENARTICVEDSTIALLELPRILKMAIGDSWRIFSLGRKYACPLYYELAKMPAKRCIYLALFRNYNFARFWGRDDYNFDHVIRTHELRAAGGQSFGVNHGLPVTEVISPSWRYIDFDVYHVFGRHLYETYYTNTWSKTMRVRAMGTLGLTPSLMERARSSRGNAIVYFSAGACGEETLAAALETALEFPDREFLIKIKNSRRADGRADSQIAMCANAPSNVTVTERDTYELLLEAEYALAGATTVVAEAIQLGAKTLVIDILPLTRPFYYRDFPQICVRSGAEAARRIRSLDAGSERYPWETLGGLIDLSGRNPYDIIRTDMGLTGKVH